MRLNNELVSIENGKSIDDMATQIRINIGRQIFSNALSIPSPVSEITNNFVFRSCVH